MRYTLCEPCCLGRGGRAWHFAVARSNGAVLLLGVELFCEEGLKILTKDSAASRKFERSIGCNGASWSAANCRRRRALSPIHPGWDQSRSYHPHRGCPASCPRHHASRGMPIASKTSRAARRGCAQRGWSQQGERLSMRYRNLPKVVPETRAPRAVA